MNRMDGEEREWSRRVTSGILICNSPRSSNVDALCPLAAGAKQPAGPISRRATYHLLGDNQHRRRRGPTTTRRAIRASSCRPQDQRSTWLARLLLRPGAISAIIKPNSLVWSQCRSSRLSRSFGRPQEAPVMRSLVACGGARTDRSRSRRRLEPQHPMTLPQSRSATGWLNASSPWATQSSRKLRRCARSTRPGFTSRIRRPSSTRSLTVLLISTCATYGPTTRSTASRARWRRLSGGVRSYHRLRGQPGLEM